MTDLKTAIVDALHKSALDDRCETISGTIGDGFPVILIHRPGGDRGVLDHRHYFDADRLATAVTDHALKALTEAMEIKAALRLPDESLPMLFKDRLIAALSSGKS